MNRGISTSGGRLTGSVRILCAGLGLIAAGLGAAPAAARGPKITATASARATVVTPLSVVFVQNLVFGKIVPRPQMGTVTVSELTGACTVTGPILEVGKCQYAQFAGMGSKNMAARISLTSVTNLTGPGTAMVLDQIKLGTNATITFAGNANANGNGAGLTKGANAERYTITTASGIYVLNIGGRLTVNPNQAAGTYTGSIVISVQYQ